MLETNSAIARSMDDVSGVVGILCEGHETQRVIFTW